MTESKSTVYEQYQWKAPELQRTSNDNRTKNSGDSSTDAATKQIMSILKDWKPKSLPIPSWAVDPAEATAVLQEEPNQAGSQLLTSLVAFFSA